jgi:hypothetical protein
MHLLLLMRKLVLCLLLALLPEAAFARGHGTGAVRVGGYTTRRGTYVAPHSRTRADSTRSNNWSHSGNVNPYTGQRGTKR